MKYTVNSKGVVVNEKFFEWEKFKYYSTESQTFDFMDKTLSRSSGKDTSTSGFGSISLFKDSNGFKGTLTLLIDYDDAPLHERVFSIVSKHLISYYSQDFNKVSLLQVIIGILLLAIVVLIDLFILPLF